MTKILLDNWLYQDIDKMPDKDYRYDSISMERTDFIKIIEFCKESNIPFDNHTNSPYYYSGPIWNKEQILLFKLRFGK